MSRDEKKGKRGEREELENVKILFWNVAGLSNKDKEFWSFIEGYDFVGFMETWVEEKGWENLRNRLCDKMEWIAVHAKKEKRKGRAKGGMLVGVNKRWIKEGEKWINESREGYVEIEMKIREKVIKIGTVYNDWKKLEEGVEIIKGIGEKQEEIVIVGGDFNIRTGREGEFIGEEEVMGIKKRRSKDEVVGKEGKLLIKEIEKKGWSVLNGLKEGDEQGDFTFIGGKGSTVIDYGIVNRKGWEEIERFEVEERVDSDHAPISIKLKEMRGKVRKKGIKTREVISWAEEDKAEYVRRLREWDTQNRTEKTVQEEWKDIKEAIQKAVIKKEIKIKERGLGYRKWWDKECTREKKEVKKMYEKWKKGEATREEYNERRREWRKLCRQKEIDKKEEEEAQLRNIKNETEVWKYLNQFRRKRTRIENKIGKHEWKEHFRILLQGSDEKVRGERRQRLEQEPELEEREVGKAIKKAKKKKAAGIDGITNEAWKFGEEITEKRLGNIIRRVWNGEGIPEEWTKAEIVPLYKKGDKEVAKNYRGISLLPTAYKIYTEVLRERLEKEIEEKGCLPEGQAGFRKKRSTMDNIYILNHVVQKAVKEGRKIYTVFVDLKAAFDTVCREKLWKVMEDMGISKYLIERIKELYEETSAYVRTEEGSTEEFWIRKGVRQGCLLSPALFSLYIADLEKRLEERNIGGVKIGKQRVWSLAYADDMVLMAEGKEALNDMMGTLRKFLVERDLILSTEKTKVMVFGKKGREKKDVWKWEGKDMEEVKDFKYLGFIFESNGGYTKHLKELRGKGICASKKVWGLGERICSGDIRRREKLCTYLVESVMTYGVEIWGWEERKELERIRENYYRWVLGLEFHTPRYIIREEMKLDKLKEKWGERAVKFEEKIRKTEDNRLVKMCWMEKEKSENKDLYGKERKKFLQERGWSEIGFRMDRERGIDVGRELRQRGVDIDRQEREAKIREGKYNENYRWEKKEGIPKYIKESRSIKEIRTKARIRCGNMEEVNRYWLDEEKNRCKLCDNGEGKKEHYMIECETTRGWFEETEGFAAEKWKRAISEERDKEITNIWRRVEKEKEKKRK